MFSCFSCDEREGCALKNARKCKKAREINRGLQKELRLGNKVRDVAGAHNLIRDKLKTI